MGWPVKSLRGWGGVILASGRNFYLGEQKMATGKCDNCDEEIVLETDDEVGDYISCDECGAEQEIKSLNPVKLEIIEQESDLDDDDDEDEDEDD